MAKWRTSCAAVRWTLLFLLVVPTLVKTTETEENFEGTTSYTGFSTEYPYPEITTDTSTSNTEAPEENTTGPQRSERMVVVYVKPDPKAETKNITDFLDSDDVVYTTGEKETIIVTDSKADEEEITQNDGDLIVMGRSLKDNVTDKLPSEAGEFRSKKQPNPIDRDFNLKDVFNNWNSEVDFTLSDLFKVNLASLLADEYEEMNRLMNENLVEDKDESMNATMTDALEPRNSDDGKDLDQTAAASSEIVQQVLPVPEVAVTLPQVNTIVRPSLRRAGQLVRQYTYQPNQRSDSAPSYILLPRSGNGPGQTMALLQTGNTMRLPMPTQTLPRTVAQHTRTTTVTSPRPIRRPQATSSNRTTAQPPSRFGERFAGRLPRPFQYILNMTVGGRQTTTEKSPQTFLPSSVLHLPSPSQTYPARVRAPNRYFSPPSTHNNLSTPMRIGGVVATTEGRTTKPRVTTAAPSSYEFGARIRPFRIERQGNSTNVTQNVRVDPKVHREMKINQLRSNLAGKLVVMQSMLEKKHEKSGNIANQGGKLAATRLNRKGLPNGVLQPIVPLRPKVNTETTTMQSISATGADVPVTTTEFTFGLKDKKKYRRPPSFRKGSNYKLSAEKQTEDATPSNPTRNRESMVVLQIIQATSPSTVASSTETSAQSLQRSSSPATVMFELNETSLPGNTPEIADSTKTNNGSAATTNASETEIVMESVETSPAANTTGLITHLQEPILAPVEISQNATETVISRDVVNNNTYRTFSSNLELTDIPLATTDRQETTLAPVVTVENATENSVKNEEQPPSSTLQLEDTSLATIDRQETTLAPVVTVENATENSVKNEEQPPSSTLQLEDTSLATIDRQETTLAPMVTVENATENSVKNEEQPPSSTLELEDTSLATIDRQETTLAPVVTVENATENSVKNEEQPSSSTLELEDTSLATTDRQETTWATVGSAENATKTASIKVDEQLVSMMPEFITLKANTPPVETTTENLFVEWASNSTSTYVPEEDPYLKAMIERALQLSDEETERKASPLNQKESVWADDFVDDDDNVDNESDDESELDFPYTETDGVIQSNEESLSSSTLSRFDRSVGSTSREDPKMAVDTSILAPNHDISPVLNLARGSIRPINLPYNILPDSEVTITR